MLMTKIPSHSLPALNTYLLTTPSPVLGVEIWLFVSENVKQKYLKSFIIFLTSFILRSHRKSHSSLTCRDWHMEDHVM